MPTRPQPYHTYTPLDTSTYSIRLCRLLPGIDGSPIRCELEHVDICSYEDLKNDAIRARFGSDFYTLSYTWGSDDNPRWIRLNDKPFIVLNNLLEALKGIREDDQALLIWIDAICIDQQNIAERNKQVSFMAYIYQCSKKTIVWLGPDSGKVHALVGNVRHSEFDYDNLPEAVSSAIDDLEARQYWSRAWVIQEFLSAEEIDARCGRLKLSFEALLTLPTRPGPPHSDTRAANLVRMYLKRWQAPQIHKWTLWALICQFDDAECSDPRDRIFCLISQASDCAEKKGQMIDYKIYLMDLYFAVLNFCRPARIAEFATKLQHMLSIPSAVTWKMLRKPRVDASDSRIEEQTKSEESQYLRDLSISFQKEVPVYLANGQDWLVQQESSTKDWERTDHPSRDGHAPESAFFKDCAIATIAVPGFESFYMVDEIGLAFMFRNTVCGTKFQDYLQRNDESGIWTTCSPPNLSSVVETDSLGKLLQDIKAHYDDAINPVGRASHHVPDRC
jgi:hypothetical protein